MKSVLYCVTVVVFLGLVGCNSDQTLQLIPGPAGPSGPTGQSGPTGPSGPSGQSGPTGPSGSNGHSLVSEVVAASGLECTTSGQRLDIYLDMDDSLTVSEGDLYQSSLIACNGSNGLDGSVGPAGEAGPAGSVGPAGQVGPSGAQGNPGPVGPAGPSGPQGSPGAVGPAGSGATIQAYGLTNSCQSVSGGFYAKADGGNAKIYTSSSCNGNSQELNSGDSLWLSSTRLAFVDDSSGITLRVLNFN